MTEFEKWMHDDIAFCMTVCDNEKCFRHPSNILTDGPHSFSEFGGTEFCPLRENWVEEKYIETETPQAKKDIVPVVRCKDCKWSDKHKYFPNETICKNPWFDLEYGYMVTEADFFCAKGERK